MAKVPVIPPLSSVSDPNTRSVLMAMQDQQRVRSGEVGDGSEKFLTVADLTTAVSSTTARQIAANSITSGGIASPIAKAVGGAVSGMIDAISEAIVNSRFWKDLTARLAVMERPEWFNAKFQTAVTVEQNTRQTADRALASQITTVFANLDGNLAGVREELEATVTEYEAFSASTTSVLTELDGNMTAAETSISSLTTKTNSTASAVTNLQTTVANVSTTAQQAFTLASDVNGDVQGSWVTKFDVNGYVTGFGLGLDVNAGKTPKSTFAVLADKFVIGHSSAPDVIPFSVVGGQTYIKQAMIGAASIDTLRIAGQAVIVPASTIYVNTIGPEFDRWIYVNISGLNPGEQAPIHVHIGLCTTAYNCRLRVNHNGIVADDTIRVGEHGYLAVMVLADSNNTFGIQLILESAASQLVRLTTLALACKR